MAEPMHTSAIGWARTVLGRPGLTAEGADRGDAATTYRLSADGTVAAYLKVGSGGLAGERDRLTWLGDRVPVHGVLGFAAADGQEWLLTAPLRGADLSQPVHTARPHRLVRLLASALRRFHAIDPGGCPFGVPADGAVVVHGDACLPNVVFAGTDFGGYLDVGAAGLGSPEVDLAAAVWSLDHNLGPGFGGELLRRYGWPQDDPATVERLRRSYEAADVT
jgi:aminoglycoside phosphotransferase